VIVNLIRTPASNGAEACHAEGAGIPAHLIVARPFEDAEAEVKRRVLRSLADRANPPSNIAFVRTWEAVDLGEGTAPAEAEAPKPKRQRGGAKR
jgi:hypothetical protein